MTYFSLNDYLSHTRLKKPGLLPELRAHPVQVRRQPQLLHAVAPDPAARPGLHGQREHLAREGGGEEGRLRLHQAAAAAAVAGTVSIIFLLTTK